jgi:hypothetical protein
MKKTITYQGPDRTNASFREALELANSIIQSLSDGTVEFTLEYTKSDGASSLQLQTLPKDTPKKTKPSSLQ